MHDDVCVSHAPAPGARSAAIRELDRLGFLHLATRVQDGARAGDLLGWSPPPPARRVLQVLELAEAGRIHVRGGR